MYVFYKQTIPYRDLKYVLTFLLFCVRIFLNLNYIEAEKFHINIKK